MNKYEMLYILKADIEEAAREAAIARFADIVTSNGGNVENIDKWGIKKLAYEINYKSEGYYVLMTFECDPAVIAEITRQAGIADEMMRHLISKL